MKHLKFSFSQQLWILAFAAFWFLTACSKTPKDDPKVVPEKQYVLRELRYQMSDAGSLDTVTLNLQDTTVLNPANVTVTTRITSTLSHLVKTSLFEIGNPAALPEGVDFTQFQVNLPSNSYPDHSLSYTPYKVPFTTKPAEYPYNPAASDTLTIHVPARSGIVIKRSIQAQNMVCPFTAVLEEQTTGQTYSVKGTWKGLLRYDKLDTRLTERPL